MAILTFAQAKAQVARVLGNETDTVLLDEAGDEIKRSIEELSLKDLEFLLKVQTVAIVGGTADYNLNTDFRKVYSVRLDGTKRPLMYVEQRLWDRVSADQTSNRTPFAYTLFPRTSNTQAQIRIIPPPQTSENATVKYYRLLTIPSADGDTLDILERYQSWLVFQARANLLANHNANPDRVSYWTARADRVLADMKTEDQHQPDRDEYFMPAYASSFIYPPDHPLSVLRELEG